MAVDNIVLADDQICVSLIHDHVLALHGPCYDMFIKRWMNKYGFAVNGVQIYHLLYNMLGDMYELGMKYDVDYGKDDSLVYEDGQCFDVHKRGEFYITEPWTLRDDELNEGINDDIYFFKLNSTSKMGKLIDSIYSEIAKKLNFKDLINLMNTCKAIYNCCSSNMVWKFKVLEKYGNWMVFNLDENKKESLINLKNFEPKSWKRVYHLIKNSRSCENIIRIKSCIDDLLEYTSDTSEEKMEQLRQQKKETKEKRDISLFNFIKNVYSYLMNDQ